MTLFSVITHVLNNPYMLNYQNNVYLFDEPLALNDRIEVMKLECFGNIDTCKFMKHENVEFMHELSFPH